MRMSFKDIEVIMQCLSDRIKEEERILNLLAEVGKPSSPAVKEKKMLLFDLKAARAALKDNVYV